MPKFLCLFSGMLAGCSIVAICTASPPPARTVWLDNLNLETMDTGWGQPHANATINGNPIRLRGTQYAHGVGTHAYSDYSVNLNGKVLRFEALVGIDDEVGPYHGAVNFELFADGKLVYESGMMRETDPPRPIDVDLTNADTLRLVVDTSKVGTSWNHADWAMARFTLADNSKGTLRPTYVLPPADPFILTPKSPAAPRINGPSVYGARPSCDFLYLVPATGEEPIRYAAANLPVGLRIDETTGIISGAVSKAGSYRTEITAVNKRGSAEKVLTIKIGDTIALTPPLGWNSWNCFADNIDEAKIREAADILVRSGLSRHGWSYVNMDDGWQGRRGADGTIVPGKGFRDMRALAAYIHAKGLKFGLYSSPGAKTCTGYEGSLGHEAQDARTYAGWGVDYLKYDWCSCRNPDPRAPYRLMSGLLLGTKRDIVFSLCQYGMDDVWKWGSSVGGNLWRTDGDIDDSWGSLNIGFRQNGMESHAGPGHWNDPDMMVVGWVRTGLPPHPSRLRPDEQYTHVTLWSLMAAPLLIGCDLSRLDAFTLNLLSNDEVLDVDQDSLGEQGHLVQNADKSEIWAKRLSDGSLAVAFFNRSLERSTITLPFALLDLHGPRRIRDLWRQMDLPMEQDHLSEEVAPHGTVFVKISAPNP